MRAPVAIALIVLTALAGCTAPASDPEAWPAWHEGDTWTWSVVSRASDGGQRAAEVRGVVIHAAEDIYTVRTRDSDGNEADISFWRSNLSVVDGGGGLRFPLEEGKTWEVNGERFTVAARETVTVPAGVFESWRVNITSASTARDEWWAEDARIWVKAEQTISIGPETIGIDRELQDLTLVSG